MATLRTIVETPRFAAELKAIHPDAARADELTDGVKWILARDPAKGHVVLSNHVSVWFLTSRASATMPTLSVFYLGLRPDWFDSRRDFPHYDLNDAKFAAARALGAAGVDLKAWLRRQAKLANPPPPCMS